MTSLQSRPKSQSQAALRNSTDLHMTANSLSNRGIGSRVVYKNAREEYDVNDKRSLYAVSYNKNKPKTPQQSQPNLRPQVKNGVEQLTLADIVSTKRVSSAKSPNGQKRPVGVEVAKASEPSRKSQSNAGFEKIAATTRDNDAASVSSKYNFFGITAKTCDSQGVKDSMTKEYTGSPYVKVDDEAEYYETVKRLDVCGKCWSAQQKYYSNPFKVNHKGPGKSLYQRDFVKHPLNSQGPVLKNDFYSTWQNNTPVDYGTTMSADFKDWKAAPPKRETMNWRPATSDIPFAGSSNYRTDYANWGANPTAALKAPQNKTVISELPFMSQTTYGTAFAMPDATSQLKPVDRDLWKKNKAPFASAIPFLGESTNAATYKPFKVSGAPEFEIPEEYQPTEALPEHQRSLYQKDFGNKDLWKCPAVIFMENNPHPKYKHLSGVSA